MPSPISQIQSVLDAYTRQLRGKREKEAANMENRRPEDQVSISSEAKRREILSRIGDAAVKAYKKTTIDAQKDNRSDQDARVK
jgi:hypothetical protein